MLPSLSITLVALTFLVTVESVSFSKRVQSNAPGWDPHLTPYPAVRRGDVVLRFRSEAAKGNVSIADPYNYFETSNPSDFVKSQLAFSKTYLDKLEDLDAIRTAFKEALAFSPLYAPTPYGPKDDPTYIYSFKQTGEKFSLFYIAKQKDLDAAAQNNFATLPGKVLLDESLLGGKVIIQQQISPDGTKLLYSIADHDTYDNVKAFVRDISNPLTDKSKAIQEGGYGHYSDVIIDLENETEIWSDDSKSIFYTSKDGSIRYHVLGTNVKDDPVLVKPNKDSQGDWWAEISDDQKYLFVVGSADSFEGRRVYAASLDQKISGPIKWVPIAIDYSFFWDYVTNTGNTFFFETSNGAPNYQIVRLNLDFTKAVLTDDFNIFTQGAKVVTVVPQLPDAKIVNFASFDNDKVLIVYNTNDAADLIAFSLNTGAQLQRLALDIQSTSVVFHALASSTDVYVQIDSLNTPSKFYHLKWDQAKNKFISQLAFEQKGGVIEPDTYIVERHTAPSKTGNVEIPFYVLHHKDLKLDGSNPVLISFYGSYGYDWRTVFVAQYYAFVRSYNVVFILAAPRGGGEKGDDWHKAGQLNNKQNTFDDILAIAQYAIDTKWTSPGKVILDVIFAGASASATIVNQAPEGLIGAFIGLCGIYDFLRLDQSVTQKAIRIAEYGSPSDPKAFDWLRKYSPLQNIDHRKVYPTILIYPSPDNSDIEPWHSYKYISELQFELPNNPNPILLGNVTDTDDEILATGFALAAHVLGLKRVN